LRNGLAGVGCDHSHGERHNQAADDQSCFSGKVQKSPNRFSIVAQFGWGRFTIPADS
jgi:hypothetical protein